MTEQLGLKHRFIAGSKPQTLLLLHGTGGDENDLITLGRGIDPEASILSPRGQVLEEGMPRFFRRLAPGVFDLPDLLARTHELATFVDEACQAYKLQTGDIIAIGYSNGANIAASLLLLHPGVFRAAALLHAMVPFEPSSIGMSIETKERPILEGTNVLLTAGRQDSIVPSDQAERLARILEDAGATVRLEWQPGGHELTQGELAGVEDWINDLIERGAR